MRLDPPYTGDPFEVQRMPYRFTRLRFLDDGIHGLLTEEDRSRGWSRTYLLPLNGKQSRPLFEHSVRERYRHPGFPFMRTLANGHQVAQTLGGDLLLSGQGAGPKGDRPFLDKLSLKDLSVQRLFQSAEGGVRAARGAARGSPAADAARDRARAAQPGAARERQGHAADADQGSDAAVEGRAARAGELQAQRRRGALVLDVPAAGPARG
ncbi:hypothetical protein ACFJIX_05360 [Roseateles sp. UC29_93]|uniref:hypothetical protein n=1 Tax=Roseateles sp. UC29_93 TaxID=3350177 RepID=UPI00366C9B30